MVTVLLAFEHCQVDLAVALPKNMVTDEALGSGPKEQTLFDMVPLCSLLHATHNLNCLNCHRHYPSSP